MDRKIKIVEVGPRDGLQNEKIIVSTQNKIKFIKLLSETGLQEIEVGSFVNPKLVPQLADSEEVIKGLDLNLKVIYTALVPNMKGLERAKKTNIKRIAVFTAASEAFNKNNINMTIDESLENFTPIVKAALASNISVRGYISTCFICPFEGKISKEKVLYVTRKLLDLGLDEISLGDTVGKSTPEDVSDTLEFVLKNIPKEKLALHFHDTSSRALENVEVGLRLGINTFDSSTGGLGGCPFAPGARGNLVTEDLINFLDSKKFQSGVNIKRILEA